MEIKRKFARCGGIEYLPNIQQFDLLENFNKWKNNSDKNTSENSNLMLLYSLTQAEKNGVNVKLGAYEDFDVELSKKLEIGFNEDIKTGELILTPIPKGDFKIDLDDLNKRLHQIKNSSKSSTIRTGKQILILNEEQTTQAKKILENRTISKEDKSKFLKNPIKYFTNDSGIFSDLGSDFMPRVIGIGEFEKKYSGFSEQETENWFDEEGEQDEKEKQKGSSKNKQDTNKGSKRTTEKSDEKVYVPLLEYNDEKLGFGIGKAFLTNGEQKPYKFDINNLNLKRNPFPHQIEAIRWIVGNALLATQLIENHHEDQKSYGSGCLLADDMGLGKTMSILVGISEWFRLWRKLKKTEPSAVLIVAPLSLLENWKEEIDKIFNEENNPFKRIIIAHNDNELLKFRKKLDSKDIVDSKNNEVIEYGLNIGKQKNKESLDWHGSCVITTYETLANFRFSFARGYWSTAIFDESQAIKNPNAI